MDKSDRLRDFLAGVIVGVLFMSFVTLGAIGPLTDAEWRRAAITNNAAHWETDPRGSPVFTWGPRKHD